MFQSKIGALWQWWQDAQRRLVAWRDYEIRMNAPDERTKNWIADGAFAIITDPLSQQGFEPVGDYVLTAGIQSQLPTASAPLPSPHEMTDSKQFRFVRVGVACVFEHKEYGCIAFASASIERDTNQRILDLRIMSAGDGWTYTSIMGKPDGADVGLSARDLKSYHMFGSVEGLIEAHLRYRAEIARVGGFSWEAPMTMEEIVRREEKYAEAVRDFGRRHNRFSLFLWERRAKRETHGNGWGELTGELSLPKISEG